MATIDDKVLREKLMRYLCNALAVCEQVRKNSGSDHEWTPAGSLPMILAGMVVAQAVTEGAVRITDAEARVGRRRPDSWIP